MTADQPTRPVVAVVGTMDTKGAEHAYVCQVLARHGADALVIDTGILGDPRHITADISAADVAQAAGTTLAAVRAAGSRGAAVELMEHGLVSLLRSLQQRGRIHGIVALGGAEGTVLGTTAMQALPLGFPKVMVSAIASGPRQFGPFVGASDVTITNSVVDVAGLNTAARAVFGNAAAGIAGMAGEYLARASSVQEQRPVAAVSMLGNTQTAFDHLAPLLDDLGLEAVPFHANGVGGVALDRMATDGTAAVVVDMTLNEISNDLVGGVTAAPPERGTAAGRAGVPRVVVPGCLDFFTFGPRDTVPKRFTDRVLYTHNPHFTLVRATAGEMAIFGTEVAARLNTGDSPLTVIWPENGLSIEDREGGLFHDPEADQNLLDALIDGLTVPHTLVRVDAHINDPQTAQAIAAAVHDHLIIPVGATASATPHDNRS